MNITLFNKTGSTKTEHGEFAWPELVQFFSTFTTCTDEQRHEQPLFTGWRMKPHEEAKFSERDGFSWYSRCIENCVSLSFLTLDVDNDPTIKHPLPYWSLEDAIEDLTGLEAIFYTSFNHKNPEKHGGVDKFRVLIPMHEPLPYLEYRARQTGIRGLFPSAANESFTPSQPYWIPLQHPGRTQFSRIHHSKGAQLDWTTIEPAAKQLELYTNPDSSSEQSADNQVLIKATSTGVGRGQCKTALDWYNSLQDGWEHKVPCFSCRRHENNPSAFFYREGPFLKHWDKQGPVWTYIRCVDLFSLNFVRRAAEPAGDEPELPIQEPPAEEVRPQERKFKPISTDEERTALIRRAVQQFLKSVHRHGGLRTPEGMGKTTISVQEALRQGQDVLLCCLSHVQVKEKMQDFKRFNPIRVYSLGALILERFKLKPISFELLEEAWEDPGLDLNATVDLIVRETGSTEPEVISELEALSAIAAESRKSKAQLLITTFATGAFLFKRAGTKLDRFIIIDDASMGDLLIGKFGMDENEEHEKSLALIAERKVEDVMFGLETKFQDKVLWTTTEKLVLQTIKVQHPGCYVCDVVQNIDTESRILMLPSFLTRKKLKPILPGIHRVVQNDTKTEQLFLANGTKGELNLVNTKGRNDLEEDPRDLVIVISFPHPCDIAAVTYTLGLGIEDRNEVRLQMVTDIMDQAIGRKDGYRGKQRFHTLIVCDPNLEMHLRMRSRYRVNTPDGLKRRGRFHGCPLEWHVEIPTWWSAWFGFLSTWMQYVKIEDHRGTYKIRNVLTLEGFNLTPKQYAEVARMLKAPTEFSELIWKTYTEYVEVDNSRRNQTLEITELVSKFNDDLADQKTVARKKAGAKGAAKGTGKRKFVNPMTKETKMIVPGTEEKGWVQVKNKVNN